MCGGGAVVQGRDRLDRKRIEWLVRNPTLSARAMSLPASNNIVSLPRTGPSLATPRTKRHRGRASSALVGPLIQGLALLAAFDAQACALTPAALASRTGLPRATVTRLARSLVHAGYLRYHEPSTTYSVWTGALRASHALMAGLPLRTWARPGMRDLAIDLQACVSLHLLDGDESLTLDAIHGGALEGGSPEVGSVLSALDSPAGWALLALLPDTEREARMVRVAAQAPERWMRHGAAARTGVQSCRREGYCTDLAQPAGHLRTVGAPLARTADGVCFALVCSIEDYRLRPRQLQEEIGPRLLALARSIRAAISGAASP